MSDPALQGPEGLVARQKLLDGGYKPEEVDQWQQQTQQEQFQKGWDPKDIDTYWGKNPDMSGVKAAVDQSFKTLGDGDKARIAETPWDMFRAGLQTSAVEIPFGKPTILPPQHAGMASNILYRFGQGAGDLPATVLGWMGGKAVGALAGGAAASAAGPEAAPVGAAVGGLIGAGAGSAALPEVWRQAWMDHQANPDGYKTWSEFWSHTAEIMHDAGKQALIGAVSAPLGGLAGHAVGGALAEGAGAAIASRAADTVTMAGAATAVGAALDGHVPTTDDLATAAVLTLGFHAAGEFHGATMRFRPSEPAQVMQANLRDAYVATGRNPMAIAQIAHSDVAVQGEVLGPTAADGTRLTPALDAMKLDEPPPFVKPPETPTEPEAGAPPVKEPETSASEGVTNENGLTHEEQALFNKAMTTSEPMTTAEMDQHVANWSNNPAYAKAMQDFNAAADAKFEAETSPTLALQGDTPEWVPPAVGHINEPNIIEPLPATPTDGQKSLLHIDPETRKDVTWSEGQGKWVAPHEMSKSDWQHLQGLVEPKIGQAEKEPTSWWHGSSSQDPSLDPKDSAQGVSAVWVASSRYIAKAFSKDYKGGTQGGTMTRVHIAAGKYFDFRDIEHQKDLNEWMKKEGMDEFDRADMNDGVQRGQYTTMETYRVQKFLKDRGYEGYFEREKPNTPVNLAVFDKNKIMKDESGPSPVKKQLLRLKSEQAEAEGYTEPGSMLTAYAEGERMTPEEEASVKGKIVKQDLTPPGGGEPPKGGGLGPHTGPEGEPPRPETWQEANQALLDTIDPTIKKGVLPDWLNPRKWLAGFQGQLTPARQLDMMLGSDPKQMTVEDHAREGSYASGGRVNSFFRHGNLRITDSKKWTMARVDDASQTAAYQAVKEDGGNVADFTTLRMALRTLEKAQQGIDIHPVLTPERALARLQEPGWQDKYSRGLKIMKEHTDGVVNYAQDAHLFSPELAGAYKTNNKIHINLRRVMNPDYDKQGGGGAGIFNPTKKLKGGSDRPFDDIVSAGFKNTDAIISMADRNLFHLNTIDHVLERPEGLKQLGYDGFSRVEAKDLESEALLNGHLVDEEGTPLTEAEKQGMLPFLAQRQFNARPNANRGDYLVFRNGKPEVYHTDNADLQAVLGMASHATPHAVFQVAIKLAGLERAGIIGSPGFLLRSLTHQQMASAVTGRGEAAVPFLNMWKGIMPEMLGGVGKDAWEEAAAHGVGTESTIGTLDFSRDPLLRETTRTFDKAGTWSSVMNMARAPFDAWRALSNRLHQASAVAGYQKLKMQGYDPGKAAMITRTDYLDHAEPLAASFANTFARMTPFMSTGLKDIEQLGRALQDRPVSTIMNGLVKLTLPTLALSYVNDQVDKTLPPGSRYSDLPEWRRDLFWNIPVAGVHIAIPKPYAVGFLFAGLPQMMMEHMRDGRPADFERIGGLLAKQMLPPAIPTAAAPILDNLTNTHFPSSVPLVPASLAGVTGWMQYKADTSGAAKKLSQVLGPAGMNVANFSPIVLDNYIQKWAGTLPMQAFRAIGASWAAPGPPKTWSDNPLFGSFIVRNPGAHSQVVEDLFTKIHEFETAHASFKLAEKHMDPEELQYNKTAQAEAQIGIIKRSLTHQMGMLNAINSSKVMTDEEKTKRGDYLSQYMVKSAEHSLAYMNRASK